MCVPVGGSVAEKIEGVDLVDLPTEVTESVVHRGSYDDMGEAYATVSAWIHERGHRIVGPSREIYLNSPADVGEDELLTEIHFPIDADGES